MHTRDEVFFVYSNFFSMGCVQSQYNLMRNVNNEAEVEDEGNFVEYVFFIPVPVPVPVPVGVGVGVPERSPPLTSGRRGVFVIV